MVAANTNTNTNANANANANTNANTNTNVNTNQVWGNLVRRLSESLRLVKEGKLLLEGVGKPRFVSWNHFLTISNLIAFLI